jgi:hypothetical protein
MDSQDHASASLFERPVASQDGGVASTVHEDVRLFLLGWMGGLVFFGTLFA